MSLIFYFSFTVFTLNHEKYIPYFFLKEENTICSLWCITNDFFSSYLQSLGISFEAQCFQAIKHSDDGDIIQVRDCVVLRSGPKKTDIPFVAKVTQFWKHPQDGEKLICSDLIDLSNRNSGGYITTCISRVLFNLSIIRYTSFY